MDKNINNDKDIEKIVSETFQNPDVLSFIVKQIKDQIEKEQNKVQDNKITDNKITDKINKIQSKADTYFGNNNYLKDYVDNRDKYMNVFNDVSNNLSKYEFKKEDSTDKTNSILDKLGIPHDEDGSVTIPINKEISNNVQSNYTHFGWEKSSNKDKILGYLYFDNKGRVDFDKVLDVYSTLSLYQEELTNWEYFDRDYTYNNYPISYSLDNYVYYFEPNESKDIDSNEANIISYIYIKPDDDLNMISVYMINCNTKTNKIYDFTRLIYTPCDNCSEASKDNFYYHLEKLITSNKNHIENRFEDYCYTYINQYKIQTIIDGVEEIICTNTNDVYKAIQDGIFKIIEEKKKIAPYRYEPKPENEELNKFLSNAINDGFIKVEIFSPEHIYLNINGTSVFMQNPYASIPNKDIWGNEKH